MSGYFAFDGENLEPQEIRRAEEDVGFPPPFHRDAHNQRARIYRPGELTQGVTRMRQGGAERRLTVGTGGMKQQRGHGDLEMLHRSRGQR